MQNSNYIKHYVNYSNNMIFLIKLAIPSVFIYLYLLKYIYIKHFRKRLRCRLRKLINYFPCCHGII
jgi:hypothetical protein